jgi:hypothetical protein
VKDDVIKMLDEMLFEADAKIDTLEQEWAKLSLSERKRRPEEAKLFGDQLDGTWKPRSSILH